MQLIPITAYIVAIAIVASGFDLSYYIAALIKALLFSSEVLPPLILSYKVVVNVDFTAAFFSSFYAFLFYFFYNFCF